MTLLGQSPATEVAPHPSDGPNESEPIPFDPPVFGVEELQAMGTSLDWAQSFLGAPHPAMGRKGPVCPFIGHALDERLLHMTCRTESDCESDDLRKAIRRSKAWFTDLQARTPESKRHLVAVLIILPGIDRSSSEPLDALHAELKSEFVESGLMLGQFHPQCQAPGLWSRDFRPLQSPIPLLAIRQMTASDLPFLIGSTAHAATYFERFARSIPAHIRRFLVERLVPAHAGTSPGTDGVSSRREQRADDDE